MKWIGQHIVDFIARFRSDVYLEDISTGTIASGGNLGLDSNNKVVKADEDGATLTTEAVQDIVGGMFSSNTETRVAATYVDGGDGAGKINVVVDDMTANTTYSIQDGELSQNNFTNDDHTKLNGIEASADVTDATNVTAAGALMDSEVDADIKTLSLPASTTISAYGASLVDDADAAAARATLGLGTGAVLSTAAISNGGAGLATADQIHTFVTTQTDATDANTSGQAGTVATIAGLAPNTATTQATQAAITTCANLTTTGTIGTGTWEGTKIADAFLSDNTAHLDTTQTFTGVKRISAREFTTVGGTDGDCKGDIITIGLDASSHVAGNIYFLNSSSRWVITDADAAATSTGLLAVAMGSAASEGMCIRGMVSLKTTFPGSPANGDVLYLDNATDGAATGTAPTGNGDIVRVLGYKIGSGERMWFNPDNTFIEVTA